MATVITSAKFAFRSLLPTCVVFHAGDFGLSRDCVALGESLGPLPVSDIDLSTGPIGNLSAEKYREAIRAAGYALDANCEPD